MKRILPAIAILISFCTGLAVSILHLNDQVNWMSYYEATHLIGKSCVYKVDDWTGDLGQAIHLEGEFIPFAMPHRGKSSPPRAYSGQILTTQCVTGKLPEKTTYLGMGKIYGDSALFLNDDLFLLVAHGEDLLFPIPQKYLGGELRVTLISQGTEKGNVGLATLMPPYWTSERSEVLSIQRFLGSLFSEQSMLRLGLALSFVFLLGILWSLGRRFDDISWVLCFAAAICVLNFIRFTYQFRLPYFEFSRRIFSASYFIMMFFELMFLASFLRVDAIKNHLFKLFLPIYLGVSILTVVVSPTVFFDFRMLLILPAAFGFFTMIYLMIYLLVKMRSVNNIHELLRKRLRTVILMSSMTAVVLGVQAILDDRYGIYIDSSVQMGLLAMVGFLSIRDLFDRESDWLIERRNRQAIEKKSEIHQAMIGTIGFVAHDMRRPLQIMKKVLGNADLMPASANARQLSTAIESAESLLVDLLSMSPDASLVLQSLDLDEILQDSFLLANLNEYPDVRFTTDLIQGTVIGHKNSLIRVFSNIFINAYEATDRKTEIHCHAELKGEDVVVSVSNTNSSIPEVMWQKVFDVSVTMGKKQGVGLGLAFSRLIIEKMGGKIWTTSTDSSCTFFISLPKSQADIPRLDTRELSVAVVDDDPIVLDLWRYDHKFKSVDLYSSPDSLKLEDHHRYDVIVCDYQFRNSFMDGIGLGRYLRTEGYSGKIILATFHPGLNMPDGVFDAKCAKGPEALVNYFA